MTHTVTRTAQWPAGAPLGTHRPGAGPLASPVIHSTSSFRAAR
ncbi:hypothetical protein [Goodfellowiella coeruleoviolacea]|nr:hypothetical protein [Goodfellowiella coeruleoviolacea]